MKLNKLKFPSCLFLCSVMFYPKAQAVDFYYSDYILALSENGKVPIDVLTSDELPADRTINLLIRQGESLEKKDFSNYIKQLDEVKETSKMSGYEAQIFQMKIHAFAKFGKYKELSNKLKREKMNGTYMQLKIVSLLELKRYDEAIDLYNEEVAQELTDEEIESYISLAVDLVLNYSVDRLSFKLPNEKQLVLSDRLEDIYSKYSLYYNQFKEKKIRSRWISNQEEKAKYYLDLTAFAKKYNLITEEVWATEAFLLTLNAELISQFDADFISESTDSVIRYYLDPRNTETRTSEVLYKLIEPQRMISDLNIDSKYDVAFLDNKYAIQNYSEDEQSYLTKIKSALLKGEKKEISSLYDVKLSSGKKEENIVIVFF